MPKDYKLPFMICMIRAQTPLRLTAAKFYHFTLSNFTSVSYSQNIFIFKLTITKFCLLSFISYRFSRQQWHMFLFYVRSSNNISVMNLVPDVKKRKIDNDQFDVIDRIHCNH